jgi:hypothetical protein
MFNDEINLVFLPALFIGRNVIDDVRELLQVLATVNCFANLL